MSNFKASFHKLTHWEHWPSYMFYLPNIPYSFYLALKAKNPVFFTATNPGIKNSGDGMESKYETIQMIPKIYRPKTVFVKVNADFKEIIQKIKSEKIEYPLIAKPDVGFRGILVQKIASENELKKYVESTPIDIIIQEFISYPKECGIFYYRLPYEKYGTITSITLKRFLTVIGDGNKTLSELIKADERAIIYFDILQKIHANNLNSIPKNEVEITLTVIGNHSKGTEFIDGNHLINQQLTEVIDNISLQIDGWFYGRLDIKYESMEKLLKGENFTILEINGIISEPTHIYDASKNSYFDAVKSIGKHWGIIYQIATVNHTQQKTPYAKTIPFCKEMIALRKYAKKLNTLRLQ
ncbi:MAG: D-alanine--D-alanine ligase [Flavobacteriaceae bacterium]|nr:MAG: D-alanine--D-alanine ligase [Flavobacteriaceae bacterium]